jgi:23S rRNA (adenine2503-C2)-methyltransferase
MLGGGGRAGLVWSVLREGRDPFTDPRLSESLRGHLAEGYVGVPADVEDRSLSSCGTRKLRLRLEGGDGIETVLIPGRGRTTVCLSTQVGCARGCIFCVTATMGLSRNLSVEEIVGQVVIALAEARENALPAVRNVVFMGMGEPLDNLDAVGSAISILCGPRALGIAPRHVTLSTVGTTPEAIHSLRGLEVQLAWSLHAVDDELRRELVPNVRHSAADLRGAFVDALQGRSLFIEVALIDRVNDSLRHADALASFLAPFRPGVRVNLLPMNAGRENLAPSAESRAVAFRQRVREQGLFCAIRRPRGVEQNAACGQLAVGLTERDEIVPDA